MVNHTQQALKPNTFKEPPTKKRKRSESCSSTSTQSQSLPSKEQRGLTITDGGAIKVGNPPVNKQPTVKTRKAKIRKVKRIKLESVHEPDTSQVECDVDLVTTLIDDTTADSCREEAAGPLPWNKAPYICHAGRNFITVAFDEIALEGLDGITLEALWTRLCTTLCCQRPLSRQLMEYIWKNIRFSNGILETFLLETPRQKLVIPVNDHNDEDMYPYIPVSDEATGIIGSCSTYNQRKPIEISSYTLTQAEELGNRLVLVGVQDLRTNALMSPYSDPRLRDPQSVFVVAQYCILEKIGRSRRHGEITTGPHSLSALVKDCKALFYYRNHLQQMQLVSKQICHSRAERTMASTGGLIHLHRFHTDVKHDRQLVIEHVIKLIKQKPQCRMEYMELRRVIGKEVWDKYMISKMIKAPEFRQFVKTDLSMPYRVMYPNAPMSEWKQKAKEAEKSVRVFELRNPNLNVNYIFKEEKEDVDEMNEFEIDEVPEHHFGVMSTPRIYETICTAGPSGITLRQLSQRSDCDHHTARFLCKVLQARGLIYHTLHDAKRQHYLVYVASVFQKGVPQSIKEEPVDSESECDEDTVGFIADVLKVDKNCLKIPVENDIHMDTQPSNSIYELVEQQLRCDKTEDSLIYFSNQHPLVPATVHSLTSVKNNLSTKTNKFFLSLCSHAIETSRFVPVCQYNIKTVGKSIDYSFRQRHAKSLRRPKRRKLTTFEPFKRLINRNYRVKTFENYNELAEQYKECALPSSDEECLEETHSDVAIQNGHVGIHQEKLPEHIQHTFVDHFQELNVEYRDKIHDYPPIIEKVIDKVEEELCEENFFNVDMDIFMGPKPKVLSYSKDFQEVETMLVASTLPEDFHNRRRFVSNSHRVQSRMKIVKDCINHQKAVIDLFKIQAIIHKAERAEGYNVNVDRKSLHRIFATLVRDGAVTIVKIIVRFRNITRTKNLMTLPQYNLETVLQSLVDQFKNSFAIYAKRKTFELEGRKAGEFECVRRRRFKYSRIIGRTYGFNPKISKMRILHEYLFYIVRDYTGSPISRQEARNVFSHYCNSESIDAVMNEATTLYQREATWRMFIPPLPQHKDWPEGWALISDVLLRLPLSLFVKIFNVSYIIPALPSYLNHPIRKHFIVKNLPPDIKDALLGSRKYIFSIHEIICLIAYMGLVQFGPQKLREKDQVFIYLNKNVIFYDTTTSESGYHHITRKAYPIFRYELNISADVEKYWSDLYYYAIHTKLGNRSSVIGQNIKLEYVHAKAVLAESLVSQTAESAARNDIGYLPGDGLGACCSDSAVWLHVKKNWYWNSKPPKSALGTQQVITGYRRKHLENVQQMKLTDIHHHRKGKKFKVVSSSPSISMSSRIKSKTIRSSKQKVIMRKVKPRKGNGKVRIRLDTIDKKILDRAGKCRATFTPEEDKLMLVCLACMDYLTALNKKRSVTCIALRDFMHRMLPYSKKTSLAYRRRGTQLRKNGILDNQKEELNLKIAGDFFTEKNFGKFRNRLRRNTGNNIGDCFLNIAFIYLAHFTYKRFNFSSSFKTHNRNDILQDFLATGAHHQFQEISENEDSFCKDPTNEEEINMDTIQSVIHSSLGGNNTDQKWPFQVLRVYQNFPEDLLRNAITNMRDYQIISGRKLKYGQEGTILMSGITYNLSFTYTFKQITLFPHCIYNEAHDILAAIMTNFDRVKMHGFSFEKFEQGHGLGVSEIQVIREVNWIFELPDDIITLNPNISDFSELISELTRRYNQLMRKSQEADDGTYEPEAIKHLESTLKNFKFGKPDDLQPDDLDSDEFSSQSSESESTITPFNVSNESTSIEQYASSTESMGESKASLRLLVDAIETVDSSKAGSKSPTNTFNISISDGSAPNGDHSSQEDGRGPLSLGTYGKTDGRSKSWRISDMAFMLTKGLFPELDDDERLEKLNQHFIVRYPTCRIQFNDSMSIEDSLFEDWHHKILADAKEIVQTLSQDALIRNTLSRDHYLGPKAEELLAYIYNKQNLGASSKDIRENFAKGCVKDLQDLIKLGLVLRVGVCNFSFVHHNYRHNWSICLNNDNNDENCAGFRLRVSPWIRINGEVDDKVLDKWMSTILGHCLTYPCIPFNRMCSRFSIIKPVDIYFVLEILQRLGCLQIWSYVQDGLGQDIFTDFGISEQVPSSTIDDFDDVFVETETSAITKLGAFLNRNKTDFPYAFEENV